MRSVVRQTIKITVGETRAGDDLLVLNVNNLKDAVSSLDIVLQGGSTNAQDYESIS
jgi:hypothetical protein